MHAITVSVGSKASKKKKKKKKNTVHVCYKKRRGYYQYTKCFCLNLALILLLFFQQCFSNCFLSHCCGYFILSTEIFLTTKLNTYHRVVVTRLTFCKYLYLRTITEVHHVLSFAIRASFLLSCNEERIVYFVVKSSMLKMTP